MSLCRNKPLLYGCGLFAAILVAELVWLAVDAVQLANIRKELERGERRLHRLQSRNPYPSAGNIEMMKSSLDELEYRVGELAAELGRDPMPAVRVEAAELSARIQTLVERFRKRAGAAGVNFPDSLESGFSQYASGGAIAAPEHVPRLMRQLHSVGAVTDVLVDCGVVSIDGIGRDVFEQAGDSGSSRRRRSAGQPAAGGGSAINLVASEVGPDRLYYIERVTATFTAKEESLWRVLRAFAASPRFMVVSEFSHHTATEILNYSPQAVKQGIETDDETLRFLSEGILRGESALSRPERIISGNENVQVQLTVDVYNFSPEAAR